MLIARLDPEQVGREFPLSAEKLSPILAFYAVPNLAAGIALCRRLLEFGGLGHTCAIHSQNRSAILEFGEAMPAFRVVVNSASVHGSIGYSTNLFPAMTLGCGAPGGNITSDNIGPQHLMNVKRIAWESRGVEHRTVPADQRMAGAANSPEPEAVQEKVSMPRGAGICAECAGDFARGEAGGKETGRTRACPQSTSGVDRAAIARVVENVLAAQGIARGSGAPKSAPASAPHHSSLPRRKNGKPVVHRRRNRGPLFWFVRKAKGGDRGCFLRSFFRHSEKLRKPAVPSAPAARWREKA